MFRNRFFIKQLAIIVFSIGVDAFCSTLRAQDIGNRLQGRSRLGVRFLPNSFSVNENEGGEVGFDRWCANELRLGDHNIEKVSLTIKSVCQFAGLEDIAIISRYVSKLPYDLDMPQKIRAVSVLICTSTDAKELRECLCLLLLQLSSLKEFDTLAMYHGKAASCRYHIVLALLSTIGGRRCCHWTASLRSAIQWQHSFYIGDFGNIQR